MVYCKMRVFHPSSIAGICTEGDQTIGRQQSGVYNHATHRSVFQILANHIIEFAGLANSCTLHRRSLPANWSFVLTWWTSSEVCRCSEMAWTYLEHNFTKALGFGTMIRHIILRLTICACKENIDLKEKLRASVERREKLLKEIQLVKMSPDFPQQDGLDLFNCFRCVPRCSMPSHHSQVSFHHVTRGKRWHWLDMSRFWKFRCLMIFDVWTCCYHSIIFLCLFFCIPFSGSGPGIDFTTSRAPAYHGSNVPTISSHRWSWHVDSLHQALYACYLYALLVSCLNFC